MKKIKAFIIVCIIGALLYILFQDAFYRYIMMNRYNITKEQFKIIDKKDKLALNSTGSLLKNIVVYDIENNKKILKQLLNGKEKVIVNFSNSKCFYCIEDILYFIYK